VVKVLVLVSSAGPGGGETVALRLVAGLVAESGIGAATLAARPGGPIEAGARDRGLPFEPLSLGDGPDVVGLLALVRLIRRGRYDVLHAHLNRAALWGGLAGRLTGVPVVATVHGMNRPIYYRLAHRILAVSRAVADHVASAAPVLARRIEVVPDPVEDVIPDPARAAALRSRLAGGAGARLLLVAGKLHPNKGQRLALQVLAALGPGHRLILAGEGPDRPVLERMARALSIAGQVELVGHRRDIADVMGAVDLVLIPSESEAFSLVAAEALLAGVPVVASATGGLPEVVGPDGVLVAHRSPRAWAAACRAVLDDLAAARARAARARARLLADHDPARHVERVREVYAQVRGGAPHSAGPACRCTR
jgi:glycosyltransferase involved in cell wall biosynthesis